ncbi:hypothetical protein CYMTET_27277 [Cymbomonas tetramitiformis]|uniref:Uncharacterized protein n=1 Tax=Cymbomonas tetramitiformis TaxID=36881 RepID=A0AAE0FQ33_9CHLO|nr:hypothetical protein CYMTET_27277 [Cymbomonas tetramitiformis]
MDTSKLEAGISLCDRTDLHCDFEDQPEGAGEDEVDLRLVQTAISSTSLAREVLAENLFQTDPRCWLDLYVECNGNTTSSTSHTFKHLFARNLNPSFPNYEIATHDIEFEASRTARPALQLRLPADILSDNVPIQLEDAENIFIDEIKLDSKPVSFSTLAFKANDIAPVLTFEENCEGLLPILNRKCLFETRYTFIIKCILLITFHIAFATLHSDNLAMYNVSSSVFSVVSAAALGGDVDFFTWLGYQVTSLSPPCT